MFALASTVRRLQAELEATQKELARAQCRNDALWQIDTAHAQLALKQTDRICQLIGATETSALVMAEAFCAWSDEQQGEFFNILASRSKEWSSRNMQWAYMADYLDDDGRALLEELGAWHEITPKAAEAKAIVARGTAE